jgi:hypothetical protein
VEGPPERGQWKITDEGREEIERGNGSEKRAKGKGSEISETVPCHAFPFMSIEDRMGIVVNKSDTVVITALSYGQHFIARQLHLIRAEGNILSHRNKLPKWLIASTNFTAW